MPLDNDALKDLKTSISAARKKDLNFALCMGKKAEGIVLLIDRIKDPAVLCKQAKRAGETAKMASGTIKVDGSKAFLNCLEEPPAGCGRKLKEFFSKTVGMKLKVIVQDAEGNVLEADDEDDDETESRDSGSEENTAEQKWKDAFENLNPQVQKFLQAGKGDVARVKKVWDFACGKADPDEEFEAAVNLAAKMPGILEEAAEAADPDEVASSGSGEQDKGSAPEGPGPGEDTDDARKDSDADREKWTEVMNRLKPHVEEAMAAGLPNDKKIRAVWAYALGKAEGASPDYRAAIKSSSMLVKLLKEGEDAAAKTAAAAADVPPSADGDGDPAAMPPETVGTSDKQPERAADGDVGLAEHPGAGAAGDSPPAADEVDAAGPEDAADGDGADDTEAPDAAAGDGPPPEVKVDLTGDDAAKLARVESELQAIDKLMTAYMAILPGSAEVKPAAWVAETGKQAADLTTWKVPGTVLDSKKLDKSLKALNKLTNTINAKTAEKKAWKKALDLFNIRLSTLDHHKQSTQPEIQPKVDDIKVKKAAAETKANGQNFKGAIKDIGKLTKQCDVVELAADDCAHYKAVLTARQTQVNPPPPAPATGVAKIDNMYTKLTGLLTRAAADATAGKFKDAVKKLDEIPPLYDEMREQETKKGRYDWYLTRIDPVLAAIAAMPKSQRDVMEPGLKAFKKVYDEAKFAKTKDYGESSDLMALINMKEKPFFDALQKAVAAYEPARKAFEAQLKKFETHKGRPGIEEFYNSMVADKARAEDEVKLNRFATATALYNRSKGDWPRQEKNADDNVLYNDKLTALKAKLDALRPKPAAANALAQVDALLATAAKQALARDYTGALANVAEAEKREADAKAAADAADKLGKLKDDKALDGMDKDYAKAHKVFTDMRANVAGLDTTGTFAAEIAKADTPAAAAQAAATKAPPDFTEARKQLDAAIALLEAVLPAIMAYGPFQTHLAAAKTAVDTTLPGVNTDDCIKAQIADAKKLVTDAENLAKAPGLDIAGAEAKLVEAQPIIDTATEDAALYTQVAADVVTIKAIKARLALPANAAVVAHMTKRKDRIDKFLTDIPADITAKKMKDAAAKAKEGAALDAPTQTDITDGTEALRRKTAWYDPKLVAVTGKAICAPLIASAAEKLKVYTKDLGIPNFAAAVESIRPANWDLAAAKRLLADSLAFEPKRATAETELNKARAVRNAGVETELKALETRYTESLKLGPAGNYHRATIEVEEIAATCPDLVTKANAFKPYGDARVAARAEIDKALAHDQASAIQPMTQRLSAKFATAEQLATDGEYVQAKTMMDQITADATKAIESADDHGTCEKVALVLDKVADTGILPSAVILATQTMLDKFSARPEAASAKTHLDEAAAQLTAARAGGGGAKAALKAAIAACEAADETMSQYRMLEQSVARATARIAELKSHAQATYIEGLLKPVENAVGRVLTDAVASGDHNAEATKLDGHFVKLNELRDLADDHATYLATRAEPEVEDRVEELEKHDHRYAIKPSIDTMRKKLDEATAKVAEHLVKDALTLLEEVRTIGASALMLADMRGNVPPTPDDVKAILARPDGDKELDAMIDNLEPDAQRQVLRVAFEARFGCDLKNMVPNPVPGGSPIDQPDGTLSGANVKRFYELMSDLPNSDTLDNDSMLIFNDSTVEGSKYKSSSKQVVMGEGEENLSGAYGFGREFEVGGQDEECKPTDMEPVDRFSWNTLHEVGHAVDDKHGYMDKNGKKADHGGWIEHGKDYGAVAQVFAKQYEYDETYIAQYMLHSPNIAIPEIPAGETCTPEEWESRRVAVTNHLNLAFESSRPWNSNAQAQKIAIKGRVYQESYPKSWYSYLADARKQGMTGYQFRAPGEWFSELYAAYHAGKMKKEHPATKWIETL